MRSPSRRRVGPFLLAALLVLGGAAGCGDDEPSTAPTTTAAPDAGAGFLTVMTRNLYLGADLTPLFEATADDLATVAAATYQQVLDSDVEGRMAAVAGEIAATAPDVVALQEASIWSEQAEGAAEATVRFDFVELLLADLEAAGSPYTVAATVDGFRGALPVTGVGTVAMQDRDVVLLRAGSPVALGNARSGAYAAMLEVSVAGFPIPVQRGWVVVDATVGDHTVPIVATHLEAFDDDIRDQQQGELLATVDGFGQDAIVLGDLNSAAGGEDPSTYDAMLAGGFVDGWNETRFGEDGYTCCYDADVLGGSLTERIDLVLVRGGTYVDAIDVVGDDPAVSRIDSGHWASDHAGVVADLRLIS